MKFKTYLTEALKAEDYEASIVIAWHELNGQTLDINKAGISSSVFDTLQKSPAALESGKKIAARVLKTYPKLKGARAEQFGRETTSVTAFWKGFGASNPTPKTDIKIGNMRFSLKIGLAQLMSGGKDESTATFYAALKNSSKDLQESEQFQKCASVLEDFVTSTLAPSQLRPLIKSGTNEIVNKGEKAHKEAMAELGKLFQENREFKIAFAREAMSGFEKFGEKSPAAAEYMLVASHDGEKVAIHSVYDDGYCERIADRMRLQARFKTSSRKLKGVKTGEYNFWSVISLIVDAMDESFEQDGQVLTENFLTKVKGWMVRSWSKVKRFFKQGVDKMMSFLGAEPTVTINKKIKF